MDNSEGELSQLPQGGMMINIKTETLAKKIIDYGIVETNYGHCLKVVKVMIDEAIFGHAYMAYFDGGATPNPGDMKIGGYIRGPGTKRQRLYEYSEAIGYGTNNEAEYSSLIHLLKAINKHGIWKVRIHGDSSLIVKQVNGDNKARDSRMKAFRDQALELLKNVNEWTLIDIPRSQNKEADSLT